MENLSPRAAIAIIALTLSILPMAPALAQFTGAGTQATSWVVQLLAPLVPLSCAMTGILCLTGRVNWAWFGGALLGCALFFGRDQVVAMFRGWLSV